MMRENAFRGSGEQYDSIWCSTLASVVDLVENPFCLLVDAFSITFFVIAIDRIESKSELVTPPRVSSVVNSDVLATPSTRAAERSDD